MSHLPQLRTFLEAYRAGSISKAAARVGLTQPAASAHVRALEAALGRALFVRGARGLTATPAADELARSVAAHLDALVGVLDATKARSASIAGTVHLGGPAEFMSLRVVPLLPRLMAEGLSFRVQLGGRERLYALLEADEVDLAFTASVPQSRALGYAEVARERLLAVAAPSLARRLTGHEIYSAQLAKLPLVAYDDDLPLVRDWWRHLFGHAPELRAAAAISDLRTVERMAREGAGWTVLPDYICADAFAAGALVTLVPPERCPANALHLVWNKGALRHPRVAHTRERLLAGFGAIDGPGLRIGK
jgi:DNA-binding transcriptional LysR family regulator